MTPGGAFPAGSMRCPILLIRRGSPDGYGPTLPETAAPSVRHAGVAAVGVSATSTSGLVLAQLGRSSSDGVSTTEALRVTRGLGDVHYAVVGRLLDKV